MQMSSSNYEYVRRELTAAEKAQLEAQAREAARQRELEYERQQQQAREAARQRELEYEREQQQAREAARREEQRQQQLSKQAVASAANLTDQSEIINVEQTITSINDISRKFETSNAAYQQMKNKGLDLAAFKQLVADYGVECFTNTHTKSLAVNPNQVLNQLSSEVLRETVDGVEATIATDKQTPIIQNVLRNINDRGARLENTIAVYNTHQERQLDVEPFIKPLLTDGVNLLISEAEHKTTDKSVDLGV
jgi:hypothetical protein